LVQILFVLTYLPTPHVEHLEDPGSEYVLATHGLQLLSNFEPDTVEYVFVGHGVQLNAPVVDEYVPAKHGEHVPLIVADVPAAHATHKPPEIEVLP
jgi:hypothetical protein